ETLNVLFTRHAAGQLSSTHQLEIRKMDPLMDFESDALKQSERYKTVPEKKESDKRMAEHYWENIFKDVESVDNEMIDKTGQMAGKFHFWSSLNPISFLKSVNNEISSAGFNGFIEFYNGNRDIRRGFLRKYYDKRYYENYSKVEPYLPRGKNIIKAKSSLPGYFLLGMGLQLIYLGLVFFLGFLLYRRYMFPSAEKGISLSEVSYHIPMGVLARMCINCRNLRNQVLNVFHGHGSGYSGELAVGGKNMVTGSRADLSYLINPLKIPGTARLSSFRVLAGLAKGDDAGLEFPEGLRYFKDLEDVEQVKLILTIAELQGRSIWLLDDLLKGLENKAELKEMVEVLKSEGKVVIDFVTDTGSLVEPGISISTVRTKAGYKTTTKNLVS
ncbi:MAG: hypothetical protein GY940_27085, partial [bacterium]|nr:hypothetical protein [bacterium]